MRTTLAGTALVAALALAGCGGGDNKDDAGGATPSTTGPSDVTAATAEVKAAWTGFFDGSKPAAARAAYLEDAASLAQALALAGQDPNATATTATVSSVTFTDASHATVKYDLVVKGATVLPGAEGQEVLVDGHWKVSKASFCQLVGLKAGGAAVPGCT
jgi:hypothetical protein